MVYIFKLFLAVESYSRAFLDRFFFYATLLNLCELSRAFFVSGPVRSESNKIRVESSWVCIIPLPGFGLLTGRPLGSVSGVAG